LIYKGKKLFQGKIPGGTSGAFCDPRALFGSMGIAFILVY